MPFEPPAPAVSRTCAGEAGKVGAATVVAGWAGPAEEDDDVEALAEQPSPMSPIPSHKQRFTGLILSHKKPQVHGFFAGPYQKADTAHKTHALQTQAVLPIACMPSIVTVATHGYCFDGMASAALFSFMLERLLPRNDRKLRYKSCGYGPGMNMIPEGWLDGDENAILDFRYTPSKRVTWYFDHHVTGFASPEERNTALNSAASPDMAVHGESPQVFYDAAYGSCTKLIADVARKHFGIQTDHLRDLVEWADKIDTARFDSAQEAISQEEPVLRLAAVVEHHGNGPFLNSIVPRLLTVNLHELARADDINEYYKPLAAYRTIFLDRVRHAAIPMGEVVFVDLSESNLDGTLKFATYALYPESMYSITLLRSKNHIKMAIGYNPWCGRPRRHDIASICKRHGGGGHPVVGGASFPLSEVERARQVAKIIADELNA